jgi:hypothetical protein
MLHPYKGKNLIDEVDPYTLQIVRTTPAPVADRAMNSIWMDCFEPQVHRYLNFQLGKYKDLVQEQDIEDIRVDVYSGMYQFIFTKLRESNSFINLTCLQNCIANIILNYFREEYKNKKGFASEGIILVSFESPVDSGESDEDAPATEVESPEKCSSVETINVERLISLGFERYQRISPKIKIEEEIRFYFQTLQNLELNVLYENDDISYSNINSEAVRITALEFGKSEKTIYRHIKDVFEVIRDLLIEAGYTCEEVVQLFKQSPNDLFGE